MMPTSSSSSSIQQQRRPTVSTITTTRKKKTRTINKAVESTIICFVCVVAMTSFWIGFRHIIDMDVNSGNSRNSVSATLNALIMARTMTAIVDLPDAYDAGRRPMTQQQKDRRLLWRDKPNLPSWMKDYMDWHYTTVTYNLTNATRHEYNYLILRCLRYDERCGGVSDRLKPIPLFLLAAAKSKRLFFIRWDRPCPLERFLVPPSNRTAVGFQWSMPSFLLDDFDQVIRRPLTRASKLISGCQEHGRIKSAHLHDANGGAPQYDEVCGRDAFLTVYHDMFRVMFEPSPQLQHVLDQVRLTGTDIDVSAVALTDSTKQNERQTRRNDSNDNSKNASNITNSNILQADTYSVAHFRAEYGKEIERHPMLTSPAFIRQVAVNSLRCAIQLHPGHPIYFASDNMMALQVVRAYAREVQYPIYTFDRHESVVLKLDDYNSSVTSDETDPSVYFSTFVDLYLAGNGHCVTFGRGGFGRFANLLSHNSTCAWKHVKNFYPVPCAGYAQLYRSKDELKSEGFKHP